MARGIGIAIADFSTTESGSSVSFSTRFYLFLGIVNDAIAGEGDRRRSTYFG
jgi:hypothetical protein